MLNRIAIKYAGILGGTVLLFSQFIACGSQMYQMSMHDDIAPTNDNGASADPESKQFGIHSAGGWTSIPIKYRFGKNLNKFQRDGINAAIKSWETVVGKKLFVTEGIDSRDGDDFKGLQDSLPDFINGDYLDMNWVKTGKPNQVLATTIWQNSTQNGSKIDTADIRFNGQNYMISDSLVAVSNDEKAVVDMESLALHELGHLLGLVHVDSSIDSASIMNPRLYIGEGLTTRVLSKGDIERIQRIYSCAGDACDIDKTLMALNSPWNKSSPEAH